ncbi:MAG TPA: septum formation initiator family protein [Ktedonobacteraceae bacterium]
MQNRPRRPQISASGESSNANVTTAVGMEETVGHRRARRNSLFTQTVMWVTGLICTAFLLGTLAQAWSNSNLVQQLQHEQQLLQQYQQHSTQLKNLEQHYKDPAEVESEARQQLGYIRPGEHPVIIVSPAQNDQQSGQKQQSRGETAGFWQEWWNSFFA